MPRNSSPDVISTNATKVMRQLRTERGWSAQWLANLCQDYGASQEPPVDSSLTRTKIAKLENGTSTTITLDEAWLLAGAFGVRIQDFIPDSQPLRVGAAIPPSTSSESPTLLERMADLEAQMVQVRQALGEAGIELANNTQATDSIPIE